ncbi:MAG: type II toxin-antitoxin system VapC family toxin [Bosea sp. (in: a-proteobacteria)]
MRLLLDTHIVLALIWRDLAGRYPQWADLIQEAPAEVAISAASLWEIAIKTQVQKLDPQIPLNEIEDYLIELGFVILPISAAHVMTKIAPDISTRDPFDRLLVAIAQSEDLRLVTADRALADHPVTFR